MKMHKQKLSELQFDQIRTSFNKQVELRNAMRELRRSIHNAEIERDRIATELKEKKDRYEKLKRDHKQTVGRTVAKNMNLSETTVYNRYKQLEQANGRTI